VSRGEIRHLVPALLFKGEASAWHLAKLPPPDWRVRQHSSRSRGRKQGICAKCKA